MGPYVKLFLTVGVLVATLGGILQNLFLVISAERTIEKARKIGLGLMFVGLITALVALAMYAKSLPPQEGSATTKKVQAEKTAAAETTFDEKTAAQ